MSNVMTPHQFRTPIQLTYGSLPLPNSPHIVYLSQLSCTTLRRVLQSLGTQFGSLLCFLSLSLSTSLFTISSTSSEMKRLHNEHSTGQENNKSLKFSSCKLLFPIFQSSLIFSDSSFTRMHAFTPRHRQFRAYIRRCPELLVRHFPQAAPTHLDSESKTEEHPNISSSGSTYFCDLSTKTELPPVPSENASSWRLFRDASPSTAGVVAPEPTSPLPVESSSMDAASK